MTCVLPLDQKHEAVYSAVGQPEAPGEHTSRAAQIVRTRSVATGGVFLMLGCPVVVPLALIAAAFPAPPLGPPTLAYSV